MSILAPFKRLILRAVLRNVSPMVIRILAVPDWLLLHELDAVFRAVFGWDNIGFLFGVRTGYGQNWYIEQRLARQARASPEVSTKRSSRGPNMLFAGCGFGRLARY